MGPCPWGAQWEVGGSCPLDTSGPLTVTGAPSQLLSHRCVYVVHADAAAQVLGSLLHHLPIPGERAQSRHPADRSLQLWHA